MRFKARRQVPSLELERLEMVWHEQMAPVCSGARAEGSAIIIFEQPSI